MEPKMTRALILVAICLMLTLNNAAETKVLYPRSESLTQSFGG